MLWEQKADFKFRLVLGNLRRENVKSFIGCLTKLEKALYYGTSFGNVTMSSGVRAVSHGLFKIIITTTSKN
jgi:hypothetical protein